MFTDVKIKTPKYDRRTLYETRLIECLLVDFKFFEGDGFVAFQSSVTLYVCASAGVWWHFYYYSQLDGIPSWTVELLGIRYMCSADVSNPWRTWHGVV